MKDSEGKPRYYRGGRKWQGFERSRRTENWSIGMRARRETALAVPADSHAGMSTRYPTTTESISIVAAATIPNSSFLFRPDFDSTPYFPLPLSLHRSRYSCTSVTTYRSTRYPILFAPTRSLNFLPPIKLIPRINVSYSVIFSASFRVSKENLSPTLCKIRDFVLKR